MTESQLWGWLKKLNADMTRHEDRTRRFIPDVSFGLKGINGWIELKAYGYWPSDKIPKFRNFHHGQKNWLIKRGRAGGHCFLMVAVADEIFLFGWWQVHMLGKWNRVQMLGRALTYWQGRTPPDLAYQLTVKRPEMALVLPAKTEFGRPVQAVRRLRGRRPQRLLRASVKN